MKYVLVNHIAICRDRESGRLVVPSLWLMDLREQANALAAIGLTMTLASPLLDDAPSRSDWTSIDLAAESFAYRPLPRFDSATRLLAKRRDLLARLAEAMADAAVVQMGTGGHPLSLGQLAWPVAAARRAKKIWMFDRTDPISTRLAEAKDSRRWLRRRQHTRAAQRLERFCRRAITQADAVFAHSPEVVRRFSDVWGPQCHAMDRGPIATPSLLDESKLPSKHGSLLESQRPLRLVVAGMQTHVCGTLQLIEAIAMARKLSVRTELIVLGDGLARAECERFARELGVPAKFEPTPTNETLTAGLDGGDVFLAVGLSSEPNRYLTAAAARAMPVLAFSNDASDARLVDSRSGATVPRGDIHRLADAIVRLHGDRTALAQMSYNGWRLARGLSLAENHRRRAEIIAGLLGQPARSADTESKVLRA